MDYSYVLKFYIIILLCYILYIFIFEINLYIEDSPNSLGLEDVPPWTVAQSLETSSETTAEIQESTATPQFPTPGNFYFRF